MKIKKIKLQNYKRFVQAKTISFTNPEGKVNDKTLIVGDNGSGKSSVLQAIVLLLAKAIRDDFVPNELDWPGFEYRNLQTGRLPLNISGEIILSDTEVTATRKYAKELIEMGIKLGVPAKKKRINITYDYQKKRVYVPWQPKEVFYQLGGYQFAKRLSKHVSQISNLFESVGNIYWYTEQRNSNNITNLLDNEPTGLDDIRSFLSSAYSYHQAIKENRREIGEGEFDFYEKLKSMYESVFPDRTFVGPAPRFDIYEKAKAPDFFLFDGHNQYEISGMSAGERAIFPVLMDFARWNINNSIIIIDELELHLHPPLQQTFVRSLSKIGNNNQFIFTTHSNSIISMFDEEENEIIRLQNE